MHDPDWIFIIVSDHHGDLPSRNVLCDVSTAIQRRQCESVRVGFSNVWIVRDTQRPVADWFRVVNDVLGIDENEPRFQLLVSRGSQWQATGPRWFLDEIRRIMR